MVLGVGGRAAGGLRGLEASLGGMHHVTRLDPEAPGGAQGPIARLSSIFATLVALGTDATDDPTIEQRVRFVNGALVALFVLAALYAPVYAGLGVTRVPLLAAGSVLVWVGALGLHALGQIVYGRVLAVAGIHVVVLALTLLVGVELSHPELYAVASGLFGILAFHPKETAWRTVAVATALGIWALVRGGFLPVAGVVAVPEGVRLFVQVSSGFVAALGTLGIVVRQEAEARRTEALLVGQVRALSDEMADTRKNLQAARISRQVIEAETRGKDALLAAVSHELRTPLQGTAGLVELLSETPLQPEQVQLVDTLQRTQVLLRTLADDLLDLGRIETHKLSLERLPFDPQATLTAVGSLARAFLRTRGLRLRLVVAEGMPHRVLGSGPRIQQVLLHLVRVCASYAPQSAITVRATMASAQDDPGWLLRLEVSDDGAGVPQPVLGVLFGKSLPADARLQQEHAGATVGLTVVREIVALMDGRLGATATAERGTRFWIELPLGRAAHLVDEAPEPSRRDRLDVLVAEDETVTQLVLTKMLERLGHRVRVVDDGLDALEALRSSRPDLLLLDMHMPRMDGVELVQQVRAGAGGDPGVPVLAISASARAVDMERYVSAGVDGVLPKPVSLQGLTQAIGQLPRRSPYGAVDEDEDEGISVTHSPEVVAARATLDAEQLEAYRRERRVDLVEAPTGLPAGAARFDEPSAGDGPPGGDEDAAAALDPSLEDSLDDAPDEGGPPHGAADPRPADDRTPP